VFHTRTPQLHLPPALAHPHSRDPHPCGATSCREAAALNAAWERGVTQDVRWLSVGQGTVLVWVPQLPRLQNLTRLNLASSNLAVRALLPPVGLS
jgi:hypothetical protein